MICRCGSEMVAEVGRTFDVNGDAYLWWRCLDYPQRHVTDAVAIPDSMKAAASSTIPGSDRPWTEPLTTEPPGGTSRVTASAPSPSSSEG